ncbi:MAG: lysine--tRNA ligase, partial [Peptostreptococcaceae bacterium]|nr:lysine--tRNA ligase [Peptostreptococcaceae bacterium]
MSNVEIKGLHAAEEVEEFSEEKLNEQRLIRRDKLKKLQEMGRNPFLIEEWNVDAHSMNIKNNYNAFEGKTVTCAGRIMANRHMGKASFIDIQDKMGRIQCYIRQDVITPEEYEIFVTYDIG